MASRVMISPLGGWAGVDWAGPVEPRESLQQRPQPTIARERERLRVTPWSHSTVVTPLLSCPPDVRDTSRRETSASPAWGTGTTGLVSRT